MDCKIRHEAYQRIERVARTDAIRRDDRYSGQTSLEASDGQTALIFVKGKQAPRTPFNAEDRMWINWHVKQNDPNNIRSITIVKGSQLYNGLLSFLFPVEDVKGQSATRVDPTL